MAPKWALEQAEKDRMRALRAEQSIFDRLNQEKAAAEKQAADAAERKAETERLAAEKAAAEPETKRGAKRTSAGTVKESRVSHDWSKWQSGEYELDEAVRRGRWPDGTRVGKGHVRPYLQPQYAKSIADGSKTVEGRPRTGWAASVQKNDYVRFNISGGGPKLAVRVLRVRSFPTFKSMLTEVGVSACLPECDGGVDEAVRIYHQFASSAGEYADLERQHGVVAVDIVPIYEKDEEETKAEDEESAPNPYEDWWGGESGP